MRKLVVLSTVLATLGALFFLQLSTNAQAQQETTNAGQTAVSDPITYHGFLEKDGVPITNSCNFAVQLKSDGQLLQTDTHNGVAVQDGYFALALQFDNSHFNGQPLSLSFNSSCLGDSTEFTFQSPITAVPYAHSLLPGAVISGSINGSTSSPALQLNNGNGPGLLVADTWGSGISINSPRFDGLRISDSGNNGISILRPDDGGVEILYPERYGVVVVTAKEDGVSASTEGAAYYGGSFFNFAKVDDIGHGVYARGNKGEAADLVLGGNFASGSTGDDGRISSDPFYSGSDIFLDSMDKIVLQLDKDGGNSGELWVLDDAGERIMLLTEGGDLYIDGTLTENTGSSVNGEGKTAVYSTSSTVSRFEEFGTATLTNGSVTVPLPQAFQTLVNSSSYHIFITPLGDCATYVSEKTATHFTVNALNSGDCTIDIDYRLVGERADFQPFIESAQGETE